MQKRRNLNLIWASLAALVLGCTPGTPSNPVPDMSPAPDLAVSRDLVSKLPECIAIPFASLEPREIAQGWVYSNDENALHPDLTADHAAIDSKFPWGTNIYAPADGWLQASYEVDFYENEPVPPPAPPGTTRTINWGRGLFLQMYLPGITYRGRPLYFIANHLSELANPSDYKQPKRTGPNPGDWDAGPIFTVPPETFIANARFVKKGEWIGKVGFTGLTIGTWEQPAYPPNVKSTDETWDPAGAHLHWQLTHRDPKTGKRDLQGGADPFLIFRSRAFYTAAKGVDVFKVATGLICPLPDGSPEFAH